MTNFKEQIEQLLIWRISGSNENTECKEKEKKNNKTKIVTRKIHDEL